MAFAITIPRLGWSMEEGTLVRWLKKEGDFVRAGDAVFELEGEKAAQDIESVDSGLLRIPVGSPAPGTVVAVGAIIGFLVAEGEATPSIGNAGSIANAGTPPAAVPKTEPVPTVSPAAPQAVKPPPASSVAPAPAPAAPPSVRRLARETGVKLASLTGSGPAGRITAEDVRTQRGSSSPIPQRELATVATPRARQAARELGVDWRQLQGTGRDGRVRERDVRQSPATRRGSTLGSHAQSVAVPVSSRRRTIASRMMVSQEKTASVTITTRIDASNLVGLRQQFKQAASGSLIPSYSDIIMKLVSLALQQHPLLAARAEGDGWVIPASAEGLHIGLAVDTDGGLVVPVVKSVGTLGLFELAEQSQVLIEKSRSGTLTVAEMQGSVFTITNLGSFGIDAFTPIINVPETAVLGLGRIRREPAVIEDRIVPRDQMWLSLTFDHRIVDGAPAARFLQAVSQAMENPSAWLLRSDAAK